VTHLYLACWGTERGPSWQVWRQVWERLKISVEFLVSHGTDTVTHLYSLCLSLYLSIIINHSKRTIVLLSPTVLWKMRSGRESSSITVNFMWIYLIRLCFCLLSWTHRVAYTMISYVCFCYSKVHYQALFWLLIYLIVELLGLIMKPVDNQTERWNPVSNYSIINSFDTIIW
jgi:hypothetical protein